MRRKNKNKGGWTTGSNLNTKKGKQTQKKKGRMSEEIKKIKKNSCAK